MTSAFFVVRHGESTWNSQRRWQGRSDPPLSELGERQAIAAANALSALGRLDGIVTSSLRRAGRTGELIAAVTGLRLDEPVDSLSERSAGPWEGLTRTEIEERYPGYLADGRRPEGYEADDAVVDRAHAALAMLATGRRLLVVSHGGVIHALERTGAREDTAWRRLDNLEGRWFQLEHQMVRATGERIHLLAGDGGDDADVEGYA